MGYIATGAAASATFGARRPRRFASSAVTPKTSIVAKHPPKVAKYGGRPLIVAKPPPAPPIQVNLSAFAPKGSVTQLPKAAKTVAIRPTTSFGVSKSAFKPKFGVSKTALTNLAKPTPKFAPPSTPRSQEEEVDQLLDAAEQASESTASTGTSSGGGGGGGGGGASWWTDETAGGAAEEQSATLPPELTPTQPKKSHTGTILLIGGAALAAAYAIWGS